MANQSKRELVVIAKPQAGLRLGLKAVPSPSIMSGDVTPLTNLLISENIIMRPLFGRTEERLRAAAAAVPIIPGAAIPDLSLYYRVEAPDERLDQMAERFRQLDFVEAAYVKPPVELPGRLMKVALSKVEPPSITPNFTDRQGYLDAAPDGINAKFAWTLKGGRGAGVGIIDIEGAWRFTHEDLLQNQGGVVGGAQINDLVFRNHGTAVVGVVGGDANVFGITGICPEANVRAISHSTGLSKAIKDAADMLNPGDIILIEAHQPGPRFNFHSRPDQRGYIAVQYWPDTFDAIKYATLFRGVIVVEAAGNGAENLDDPLYATPPEGFPVDWVPFSRAAGDNGAIIVGAGAPPPGCHGNDYGPDRSRLEFSNYGSCVDVQGWGEEVTTCGYGDLQGGSDEDLWYTDQFAGTSSASPIVVGALACLQGVLRFLGKPVLTPIKARELLCGIGPSQQDAPDRPASQRIGNRPDLLLLIPGAIASA